MRAGSGQKLIVIHAINTQAILSTVLAYTRLIWQYKMFTHGIIAIHSLSLFDQTVLMTVISLVICSPLVTILA